MLSRSTQPRPAGARRSCQLRHPPVPRAGHEGLGGRAGPSALSGGATASPAARPLCVRTDPGTSAWLHGRRHELVSVLSPVRGWFGSPGLLGALSAGGRYTTSPHAPARTVNTAMQPAATASPCTEPPTPTPRDRLHPALPPRRAPPRPTAAPPGRRAQAAQGRTDVCWVSGLRFESRGRKRCAWVLADTSSRVTDE